MKKIDKIVVNKLAGSELNEAVATGRGVLRINTGFAFPGITSKLKHQLLGITYVCTNMLHSLLVIVPNSQGSR